MGKFDSKAKVITLTALVASTTMVTYASQKALKSTEENAYTAKLVIDKIDKDTVKISLDNINNSAKAFQLSLAVDGDVKFNEENIKWLTSEDEEEVSNSIKLSDDKKKIDIFVSSDNELKRDGSVLEVCEIDLSKTKEDGNSKYTIIPNIEEGKISYKSVDENNKSLEVESMAYDEDLVLSFNTAPVITLKTAVILPELDEDESTEISTYNVEVTGEGENTSGESDNDDQIIENINIPVIDVENKIITINEGYEFDAKSFVEISDEDESLTLDNVKVTDESGKEITGVEKSLKSGTYKRVYTVTDSEGESSTLEVNVVVKPEVWSTLPTITGVPENNSITKYTGDIFDPFKPDGINSIVAKDARGNSLDVELSGEFNLEQANTYNLTYTAKDRFDNTKTETLQLIVIKDDAPVIEGINDVVINVGTEFDPLKDVTVSDDINKELTIADIKVSGKVTPNIPGEYKLSYQVSDGRNTTIKQRKVTVNGAPTISGDLSYIIVKNGEQISDSQILKGITAIDDIDEQIKSLTVDRGNLDTAVDGKYIVTITATDNSDLSSSVKREIIVTSDKVVELPESGNGLSKENSIKKQVIDGSAIENINKELSDLTKDNEVTVSKTNVLENVIYSIKVSPNKIAFRQVQNEYFVDITVPKTIDEKTGGIVITKYEAIKISSIIVNGNNGEMKIGDERVLTTTVSPENAENKELLWVSTNNDIVSIVPSDDSQSATIKALKKGTSTIRVIATDGSGKYEELVVQVGEQPKEDIEAPVFDYEGKIDIVVANGMKFETPIVTASDNVDTGIVVNVSIIDESGLNIEKIDTTKAGKYKIIYTAKDKAGNKSELTINVTVKEAISGAEVGSGSAISQDKALEIKIPTEVDGLNKLLESIAEDGFEPKVYGEPIVNEAKNEITYIIKIYKKHNFFIRLFKLNENEEVYYLKITVKNTDEFNDILSNIDKEEIENPEVPEVPETPEQPEEGNKDTEAPVFDYNGETDIVVVNGMNFEIPQITATDNVDTEIIVDVSIIDENELKLEEIDTTKAGKYKIIYTAIDKAGNKAEFIINVTVKEAISGVIIGSGNATSEDQALEIKIPTEVEGLNKLLESIAEDGFEPKVYGEPIVNEDSNEITYIIKIYKKQNFFIRLFNLNKNEEVYYLKLTVKNTDEFNYILSKLDKEETENPEVPEMPETPEQPESPEGPEVPETPEQPENPEEPEVPETPEQPENPEEPEVPETPEQPENPEEPEVPETPEQPENPEEPEVPETPEQPENPEEPEVPETPEKPESPEEPEIPETPEQPENPVVPDNPGESENEKNPTIPEKEESQEIIVPGDLIASEDKQDLTEVDEVINSDNLEYNIEDKKDVENEEQKVDQNKSDDIKESIDNNTVVNSNKGILGYLGVAGIALALIFVTIKNKMNKNK